MICKWCGKEFVVGNRSNSRTDLCSSSCYRSWYHKNKEEYVAYKAQYKRTKKQKELLEKGIDVFNLTCEVCGKSIQQPKSGPYKLKTCSKECGKILTRSTPEYKLWKKKYDEEYRKTHKIKRKKSSIRYTASESGRYKSRINLLIKSYKLSEDDYRELELKSKGCCSICGESLETPCIDHCHKTGEVRGLLCNKCNTAIGFLNDDVNLAFNAYKYLILNEK